MELGLTGRVASIAGASKGLGRGQAEKLVGEGAHVATCARTARTLELTGAGIEKSTGHGVFRWALDVTDSKAVADFVAGVKARLGRGDICVTNFGGPPSNWFKGNEPEDWRAAFDQLLIRPFISP